MTMPAATRNIERRNCSGHRDPHQVAPRSRLLVQPPPLAPQNQHGRQVVFGAMIELGPALVQPVNPEPALLEPVQCPAEVGHPGHFDILEGPGGRAGHRAGQPGGAACRHDHPAGPGRVRGADHGAQIMGIFGGAVERNKQPGAFPDVFQFGVFVGRRDSHHTLVRDTARRPVQSLARLRAHRHPALPRQLHDLAQAGARRLPGDEDAIQRPAGAQRFQHGMDSGQGFHSGILP